MLGETMKYKGIVIKLTKIKPLLLLKIFSAIILREAPQFVWGRKLNLPIGNY